MRQQRQCKRFYEVISYETWFKLFRQQIKNWTDPTIYCLIKPMYNKIVMRYRFRRLAEPDNMTKFVVSTLIKDFEQQLDIIRLKINLLENNWFKNALQGGQKEITAGTIDDNLKSVLDEVRKMRQNDANKQNTSDDFNSAFQTFEQHDKNNNERADTRNTKSNSTRELLANSLDNFLRSELDRTMINYWEPFISSFETLFMKLL